MHNLKAAKNFDIVRYKPLTFIETIQLSNPAVSRAARDHRARIYENIRQRRSGRHLE